jgi:glycerophosphoryl diester phosphodiesterase
MQVIAHRGWSEIAAENSYAAFDAAAGTNCQGIELDLRLTADGVVVACHDATLARFGGNHRPISRQTLAALSRQVELPALDGILERYPRLALWLEVKPHGGAAWTERLVRQVCAAVQAHRDRVFILCFQPGVLAAVARRDRRLRLVRNTETIPADSSWFARLAAERIWAVDANHLAWTPSAVAAARRQGVHTATYTVDRVADLRRCRALGLESVITNRPQWACAWLATQPEVGHG